MEAHTEIRSTARYVVKLAAPDAQQLELAAAEQGISPDEYVYRAVWHTVSLHRSLSAYIAPAPGFEAI